MTGTNRSGPLARAVCVGKGHASNKLLQRQAIFMMAGGATPRNASANFPQKAMG
jgi:hypothetical protein